METGQGSRSGHQPMRTVVVGPLAPYADGWRRELAERGYTPHSITAHAQLVAHFSTWLLATGRAVDAVTDEVVEEYVGVRRDIGYQNRTTARALAPLLGYLRGLHVVPAVVVTVPATPTEALLEEFRLYLVDERGLTTGSVPGYLRFARRFLAGLGPRPVDPMLADLSAATVTTFVVTQASQCSAGYARTMVTALRSLLRFLHVAGYLRHPLVSAVPSVPGWKFGSLPRGVSAGQVADLLASCDRDSAQGRRDYAILMLLTRLGLRAGEVIGIKLEDIDWRAGELLVVGKADRAETLPLPVDVGEAVADYVRYGRPRCASTSVFITLRAPFTGLALNVCISGVVARACKRAGIEPFGPHRLRHAVACDLLGRGASLAEIGQLLRHRSERSTAIYAKVDPGALRELARPCPSGSVS